MQLLEEARALNHEATLLLKANVVHFLASNQEERALEVPSSAFEALACVVAFEE